MQSSTRRRSVTSRPQRAARRSSCRRSTRVDDHLYLHGAAANHLLKAIAGGAGACVCVTLVDDPVLARSAFPHSLNYRSVVLFGRGTVVKDCEEKLAAVTAIVEHVLRSRSRDARPPGTAELRSTIVVRIPIAEASAKVRSGPPIYDEADLELPVWAGLVPVATTLSAGSAAPDLIAGIETPAYVIKRLRARRTR